METVTLKRTESNAYETLGELLYNGAVIAKTLELPYRGNVRRVSCIPKGNYKVVRRKTAKYGNHFHLKDVPGRSYILIHNANYYYNLLGCIGVGKEHIDINGDSLKDISYSVKTMKHLLAILPQEFILNII